MDEHKLAEIADAGRATRKGLPRPLWTWSIVIAIICVGALAIALAREWNTVKKPAPTPSAASHT